MEAEMESNGKSTVCVGVYLPAHPFVTKHDERTSVSWKIMATL